MGELDAQEAVVGLMARSLWLGHWPGVYVWGRQAMGALEPLGFYGWSTWVGRWRGCGGEVIR